MVSYNIVEIVASIAVPSCASSEGLFGAIFNKLCQLASGQIVIGQQHTDVEALATQPMAWRPYIEKDRRKQHPHNGEDRDQFPTTPDQSFQTKKKQRYPARPTRQAEPQEESIGKKK